MSSSLKRRRKERGAGQSSLLGQIASDLRFSRLTVSERRIKEEKERRNNRSYSFIFACRRIQLAFKVDQICSRLGGCLDGYVMLGTGVGASVTAKLRN